MTKEKLENELNNYKRLYEVEREKNNKLEKERENIEQLKELNIDLQVNNKNLQNLNELHRNTINLLSDKVQTYEKVFKVLTKQEEMER